MEDRHTGCPPRVAIVPGTPRAAPESTATSAISAAALAPPYLFIA
jgi:hypothetical protein